MRAGIPRAVVFSTAVGVLAAFAGAGYAGAAVTSGGDLPPDAQSQGMGRAFTAIAEGPFAVWWNPGALGLIEGIWATPYAQGDVLYYEGARHSFGISAGRRGYGAGLQLDHLRYPSSLSLPSVPTTGLGGAVGPFRPWEYTLRGGAGFDLARVLSADRRGPLQAGVGMAVKYVRVKLGEAYGYEMSGTGNGWGVDLGALARYRRPWVGEAPGSSARELRESGFFGLRAGIAAPNLIQSGVHFRGASHDSPLGREVRVGLAAEAAVPSIPRSRLGAPLHLVASVDERWSLEEWDRTPIWRAGVEGRLFEVVSARTGYIRDRTGDIEDWTYGLGIGMETVLSPSSRYAGFGWRVDYATVPVAKALSDTRLKQYTVSIWLLL